MGPDFEFHIFVRVDVTHEPYHPRVDIKSSEITPVGVTPAIRHKGGYFRVPPTEHFHDLRSEIALTLEGMGIPVRYHHHEVGASGQCEIEVNLQPLVRAADQALIIKYVIKNLARRVGRLATFMPKPIFGEAGNGMHVHQKLTKGGLHIFFDESRRSYANLSPLALSYIAGLLRHGAALTGLTNPSTNSYKRLVEGYEAPVNLFFSIANRSAAIRVPKYAVSAEDKRIEYRPPDFTCNVYLALAAMLMAGLDGIRQKLDPAALSFGPFDVDIARQDRDFRSRIAGVPRSLSDALTALEQDCGFLTQGGVFSGSFVQNWVETKRHGEVHPVAIQPHPYEYVLYLDC
jgi:glutamine synthetase